jgi:hypothetical protein
LKKAFPFFENRQPKKKDDLLNLRQSLFKFTDKSGRHLISNWKILTEQLDSFELFEALIQRFLTDQFIVKQSIQKYNDAWICEICNKHHNFADLDLYYLKIELFENKKFQFDFSEIVETIETTCRMENGDVIPHYVRLLNHKDIKLSNYVLIKIERTNNDANYHNGDAIYNGTYNEQHIKYPAEFKYGKKEFELVIVGLREGTTDQGGHWYRYQKTRGIWEMINDDLILSSYPPLESKANFLVYKLKGI